MRTPVVSPVPGRCLADGVARAAHVRLRAHEPEKQVGSRKSRRQRSDRREQRFGHADTNGEPHQLGVHRVALGGVCDVVRCRGLRMFFENSRSGPAASAAVAKDLDGRFSIVVGYPRRAEVDDAQAAFDQPEGEFHILRAGKRWVETADGAKGGDRDRKVPRGSNPAR